MRIITLISTIALLGIQLTTYGQFDTIKKIKILPEVQTNTEPLNKTPSLLNPADSLMFKPVEHSPGASVSMPLSRMIINSGYGNRIYPLTGNVSFHAVIDFKGSSDSVRSVMPGQVKKVAYSRGLGSYIEVEHGDFRTTYGHLAFIMVRENMNIKAGKVIGVTGTTGRSTGNHLHFAIKHKGKVVNPTPFLDLIYQTLKLNARKRTAGLTK